ncbi:hypothetical protein BJY14_002791 [Actinomadura luteofluorescens]|uniref:Uncharacterized protein n=1 Tax=Actinomadura luteofluorescens TaxID=46163 RepID=A0A7Y9JFP2_9ACTN|nr:hypothetical protein [Actinomadura luteofluorescens]NYD46808.1 hypothetical protein [Actinomadura luteofluorescens]
MLFSRRTMAACLVTAVLLPAASACGGGGDGKSAGPEPSDPSAPASAGASDQPAGGESDKSKGGAKPPAKPTPVSQTRPYLYPPKVGGSGAVCGTAQNNQAAQYGLKVMRGKASCSQVRTVFTTYFGYIAEVEVRGYGYDGKPLTSAGWTCRPHVKGDVTLRSIDCAKGGALVNASLLPS